MRPAVGKVWHRFRDVAGSRHSSFAMSAADENLDGCLSTMTRGSACVCDRNDKYLEFSRVDGIRGKEQHSSFVPCMQLTTMGRRPNGEQMQMHLCWATTGQGPR
ncbi:hypothetical protein TgHK011_003250 [Trichoderma gracile]|nr:hypothetical protein TgHK011_003250 [Trichoderma gracile]